MISLVIFAACVALTVGASWLVGRSTWVYATTAAVRRGADRYLGRVRSLAGGAKGLAGLVAAGGAVVAGLAVIVAVMWPLGRLVAQGEGAIDVPTFHFFQDRSHLVGWWTDINNVVTQMGNRHPTETVAVFAAVVFTLVRTSRRWVPMLVFPLAYATEKYSQHFLAGRVHRGHPPLSTTNGTWPSGGCARALIIYGLVAYFLLHRTQAGRRTRIAVWTVVATAEAVEGYTRIYLSKHWITDVLPGGVLFGALLLAVWTTAAWLMDRRVDADVGGRVPAPRSGVESDGSADGMHTGDLPAGEAGTPRTLAPAVE